MQHKMNLLITLEDDEPSYANIISNLILQELENKEHPLKQIPADISTGLVTNCENCAEILQVNVYWTTKAIKDINIRTNAIDEQETENVWDEPEIFIKEEQSHSTEDEDDDIPIATYKTRKKASQDQEQKFSSDYRIQEIPTLVFYPGMAYALPEGLELPALDKIKAPYFEIVQQPDASLVYIEKKRQKKCPPRVTNYDPRTTICDICNHDVKDATRLSIHRKQHFFPKYTNSNCRGCGIDCATHDEKLYHSLFCPGKDNLNGLLCTECDFVGTDFKCLRKHFKSKHKGCNPILETPREKTVACPLCNVKFADNFLMMSHMRSTCKKSDVYRASLNEKINKYLEILQLPENIDIPDLYNVKAPYSRILKQKDGSIVYVCKQAATIGVQVMNFDPRDKCDLCGRSHINNKNMMIQHRAKEHFFPNNRSDCMGCGQVFKTDEHQIIHSHFCQKKNEIRVNYCHTCDYQAANYLNLRHHLKSEHNDNGLNNRFMCHMCSSTFEYEYQLQLHVIKHDDPKPFKCHHCPAEYKSKHGVENHLIRAHYPSTATQTCHTCTPPMLFGSLQSYNNHVNYVHFNRGKERKPCPICGKLLKDVKTHIKEQHTEPSSKRKFECPVCHKVFFSKYNLESHSVIHVPENERQLKCGYCDRTFNRKQNLVDHERSHTGEKPFKCETCGKAFARRQAWKDHQKEHTGQGYECSVCRKMFTDRGNYRHHMKQHESQLGVKLTFNGEERRLMRLRVLTAEQALKGTIDDL